jgi:hypothetical protein
MCIRGFALISYQSWQLRAGDRQHRHRVEKNGHGLIAKPLVDGIFANCCPTFL